MIVDFLYNPIGRLILTIFVFVLIRLFYKKNHYSLEAYDLQKTKKQFNIAIVFLFFMLIINILYLSLYLTPTVEDYSITAEILNNKHPMVFLYKNYDGRYFTNFLYQVLNPLYWNINTSFYKLLPILFTLLLTSSIYICTRELIKEKKDSLVVSLFITYLYISFMPVISSGIFLMATIYHYMVLIILLNLIIWSLIKYIRNENSNIFWFLLIFIVLILGTNEAAMLIIGLIVPLLAIHHYKSKSKISTRNILIILCISTCVIFVFLSPGHNVRINSVSNGEIKDIPFFLRFLESLIYSAHAGILKSMIVLSNPSVLLLLFLWTVISPKILMLKINIAFNLKKLFFYYVVAMLYTIVVVPFPYYYSGIWKWGDASIKGFITINNVQFYLLIILTMTFLYLLSKKTRLYVFFTTIFKKNWAKLLICVVFMLSLFFSHSIYKETLYDISKKNLRQYEIESKKRFKYIQSTTNDTIYIHELRNKPKTIYTYDFFMGDKIIGMTCCFNSNKYYMKTIISINIENDSLVTKTASH